MFKQRYVLEVKGAEDRVYRFDCDPLSPSGEIHDALFTMRGVVLKQLSENHKKEGLPEDQESKKEKAKETKDDKSTT